MRRPKLVSGDLKKWVDRTIDQRKMARRQRNANIQGLRRQRLMRLKNRPPEAYQRYVGEGVKAPITYRLIETVIGAVAGDRRPQFFFASPDPELARRGRRWASLIMQAQERVSQQGMYWKFWDSLAGDGLVAIKTVRHPWIDFPRPLEGEPDEPYGRRVEAFMHSQPPVPFRSRVIDPATFYPPDYEWGPGWVVESGLRPSSQVLEELSLRPAGSGNFRYTEADEPIPAELSATRLGPQVEVDEIWTDDFLFVRIRGRVYQYENDLGFVPYVWASGSTMAFNDPTLEALSVAFPLMYIEPWINQQLSTLVGSAHAASTPTPVTSHELRPGQPQSAGEVSITEFHAGRHYDLPPGTSLDFKAPPLDANTLNLLNTMVQLAERFTLSPIPAFAGTRTPGTVMAAVAERVMSVLKPRTDQAQTTLANLMKQYVRIVRDVVRAPVVVSGLVFEEKQHRSRMAEAALGPQDVPKISDIITEIKFQTTQDRIAWDSHNVMMHRSGLWTRERAMRESQVEDPQQEMLDFGLEQLMQSPQVQLYITMRAISGVDPLESLQELFQQAEGAGGGGGGNLMDFLAQQGEGQGGGGQAGPSGGRAGRLTGEPRQPGGERQAGTPMGRLR